MSDPNATQQQDLEPPAAPDAVAGDAGASPDGPVDPPKQRGMLTRIIVAVVIVVVLAVVGIGYNVFNDRNSAAKAKVGDCLAGDEVTSDVTKAVKLTMATCDSSNARYKVVGLVPDKAESEVKNELCEPFVDQAPAVIYWQEGSRGTGKGNVLCLAAAK